MGILKDRFFPVAACRGGEGNLPTARTERIAALSSMELFDDFTRETSCSSPWQFRENETTTDPWIPSFFAAGGNSLWRSINARMTRLYSAKAACVCCPSPSGRLPVSSPPFPERMPCVPAVVAAVSVPGTVLPVFSSAVLVSFDMPGPGSRGRRSAVFGTVVTGRGRVAGIGLNRDGEDMCSALSGPDSGAGGDDVF